MKKVLVPCDSWKLKPDTIAPLHGARETYIKSLVSRGITPILAPNLLSWEAVDELYALCDGVLFMGGRDANPAVFGQSLHPKTGLENERRDDIELYILKKTLADKKPFLGICRGEQMLAIASGGSLQQHIPDIVTSERHDPGEGATYDDVPTNRHDVIIEKESKLYRLLGMAKINVNSGHHQSVESVGGNFRIVGRSPAGIVEIIEHTDPDYFCFGIQSHPESESGGYADILFSAFEQAIPKKR